MSGKPSGYYVNYSDIEHFMGRTCIKDRYRLMRSAWSLSLTGNIIFLVAFAALLQPQIYLAIRHRTISIGILLTLGIIAEIISYIFRVYETVDDSMYMMRSVWALLLLIAPVFILAALFHSLARMVVVFEGDEVGAKKTGVWKPRTYTILFMSLSGVSFLLLTVGSVLMYAIALAGLVMQLATIFVFIGFSIFLGLKWKGKSTRGTLSQKYASVYTSTKFKITLYSFALATTTILIRTVFEVTLMVYRVGPISYVARGIPEVSKQNTFMLLESTMMAIACLALTVGHPGLGLAKVWKEGGVRSGKKAVAIGEEEVVVGDIDEKETETSSDSVRVVAGAK